MRTIIFYHIADTIKVHMFRGTEFQLIGDIKAPSECYQHLSCRLKMMSLAFLLTYVKENCQDLCLYLSSFRNEV